MTYTLQPRRSIMKKFLLGIGFSFVIAICGFLSYNMYENNNIIQQAEYERIFKTLSPDWQKLVLQCGYNEVLMTEILVHDGQYFTGLNPEQYQFLIDRCTTKFSDSSYAPSEFEDTIAKYLHADLSDKPEVANPNEAIADHPAGPIKAKASPNSKPRHHPIQRIHCRMTGKISSSRLTAI
jgi:hypothetical protein